MLTIERSLMSNLMDDLAKGIYKYLYEASTEFEGNHFVLVPVTDVEKSLKEIIEQYKDGLLHLKMKDYLCP